MDRKEFLAALTALAAMGSTGGRASDNAGTAPPQAAVVPFPDRLLDDVARTLAVAMAFRRVDVGDPTVAVYESRA